MGDFGPFAEKMKAEGLGEAAIAAFKNSYDALVSGASGMIPESEISAASGVPRLSDVASGSGPDAALLEKTVVLKLNGGLGTSMGLDYAKSLLTVKGADTFLDLTAKQIAGMRETLGSNVRFMLMNSFATSADTMAFFKEKYPAFAADRDLEFIQNKVPKIEMDSFKPALWPTKPSVEWCPPGHGDLYAALLGSGKLDSLLAKGVKFMFVSNSDNLGATLDTDLLKYFAESKAPFMMECCERTANDKKGGHLAVRKSDGQLILREAAQCPDEDEDKFQDIQVHKFFNTNNLWIDLEALRALLDASGGLVPLPMIKNKKTVDPKDDSSTKVFQLETAMGAAIECFKGATAIVVPRTRFAPVKKCNDLLLLRSDAYEVRDAIPQLATSGPAPEISLDSKKYKLVQQLEAALIGGTAPSLKECTKLKVTGEVRMSSKNVFKGSVVVKNDSGEPKTLPAGVYENTTVDLTAAPGLGPLLATAVKTKPIAGQKPGTSGLRKKTKVFADGLYLHNFVQSTFSALVATGSDIKNETLLIGGDGRYYNDKAIQIIVKIAVANGVRRVWIAKDGIASTPALSAMIRERGPVWKKAFGSFLLTASHNPGGPEEDFGIKYNCENGGPAPEKLTDLIYANTQTISSISVCESFPEIDITTEGETRVEASDGSVVAVVEVIDGVKPHIDLLKTVFDFDVIKSTLLSRPDFTMVFDAMSGVTGPYAKALFVEEFGLDPSCCINATPLDDFGGHHADPNLTYAVDLTKKMGVDRTGRPVPGAEGVPSFGAASDGDGDRNMILGSSFFVTPSDSLAVLAAHADVIPFFKNQGGLKAVARSMPTSGAVDLVAAKLNLALFETPTGWKFFGNLMDSKAIFKGVDYTPLLCGEESFGTGSDHVREKDGLFAVLAWLSVLAHYNKDHGKPLVTVEDVVKEHWATYGRNYYCRYDYEGVDKAKATEMMEMMASSDNTGKTVGAYTIATADVFGYVDPVDGSVSKNQGIRFLMADGSRIVFRLSGTAGSGATVRLYIEKYEPKVIDKYVSDVVGDLVQIALDLSKLKEYTGRDEPTVIT